jgi:predicted DNA-binding protein (UPF0251 family)
VHVEGQLIFSAATQMLNAALAGFGLAYVLQKHVQHLPNTKSHLNRLRSGISRNQAERARIVRFVLKNLGAEERTALELAYFSDLSHGEIAPELGIPLGTVKTRIRSAMLKLCKALAESLSQVCRRRWSIGKLKICSRWRHSTGWKITRRVR